MIKNHKYYLGVYYRIADLLALNIAFVLAMVVRFASDKEYVFLESKYSSLLIFVNLSWLILSHLNQLYNLFNFSSKRRYFFRIIASLIVQLLVIIAFNGLLKTYYSRLMLLYTFIGFGAIMLMFRFIINRLYKYRLRNLKENLILIIGQGYSVEDIKNFLDKEDSFIVENKKVKLLETSVNIISELESYAQKFTIAELYVNLSLLNKQEAENLSNYCDNNFIRLKLIVDWTKISSKQLEIKKMSETSIIDLPLTPLDDPSNAIVKRMFDILFSLFILGGVLIWLYPLIAILIKLSSKGPVLFKQKRTGLNNVEFYCYKFRSMRLNDNADKLQATKNDSRITKVGAFLRKSSLDELPQFFNVLKGEMGVVGPRPHMIKHTEEYSKLIGNFMNRHAIKPGITGLAQVKGYRGEIDDESLLSSRVKYDTFYVNNWSLYMDVKIILLTVVEVFKDHR